MAKLAKVGYGTNGEGIGKTEDGYTYVVNDNVRMGAVIQPSVKHPVSQKIYGTTGKILSTMKEDSKKGQIEKQKVESKTEENIANLYTGKELGAIRERGGAGRFAAPKKPEDGEQTPLTLYQQQARGGNIAKRVQQTGAPMTKTPKATEAYQSYEQYSKKFAVENKE